MCHIIKYLFHPPLALKRISRHCLHGLVLSFLAFHVSTAQIPALYYHRAEGKTGLALKAALNDLITENHIKLTYSRVYDLLMELDQDSCNRENVICIYTGFSMNASAKDASSQGWNREHIWPKSYGDFGTARGAGTDLHHIRAADHSTNSARNNRNFDYSESRYVDKAGNYNGETACRVGKSAWTWEPPDPVKGDIARMILYMAVRYEGENGEPDLELVESYQSKKSKTPLLGKRSAILAWHYADPVNTAEMKRNDAVYLHQKNRNPFIDHPEYVGLIYNTDEVPRSNITVKLDENVGGKENESFNTLEGPGIKGGRTKKIERKKRN